MGESVPNPEAGRSCSIDVDRTPRVKGLSVPEEFCTVLEMTGRLAGMVRPPDRTAWEQPVCTGFRRVVCLTDKEPATTRLRSRSVSPLPGAPLRRNLPD
jgi:hypothetical protein